VAEWFEDWFGEDYLALYPHRDEADAERAVALIERTIPWRSDLKVLDVASGPGRHAAALERRGVRPIGIDLSATLLRRARTLTTSPLVRADMRLLPVRPASMDLTLNLFTSFGYFSSDEEHADVLTGMIDTVCRGGWFVLDFLHADRVRSTLVAEGEAMMDDTPVKIRRSLSPDAKYVIKEIDPGDGRLFREQVRLFTPDELQRMVSPSLDVNAVFGDYDGNPLSQDSPRAFLVGQRR
jgi:SAM-dependent methyltransferase